MISPTGDGAYLTDQPVSPSCRQTPRAGVIFARCPDALAQPRGPRPGHVWVEVEVDDGQRGRATNAGFSIDGYRATEVTAHFDRSLGFLVAADGFTPPFRSLATHAGVQVTATAPTTATQPSSIVVTGCFGLDATTARREFRAMLTSASLTTTPSQSVPATGVRSCSHGELDMTYGQDGGSQSFIGYLRPGTSVTTDTQIQCNFDIKITGVAPVQQLYLDGIATPFTVHPRNGGIPIFADGQTVYEEPLQGN